MANIITSKIVSVNKYECIIYFTLISDGTNITDYLLYDSSVVAAMIGKVDSLNSSILQLSYWVDNGNYKSPNGIRLFWKATTNLLAINCVPGCCAEDFRLLLGVNGLPNMSDGGKNGDIILNTINMDAGTVSTLLIKVQTY